MVGSGFEPLKAEPADLQSAPIGRSGNPPIEQRVTLRVMLDYVQSPEKYESLSRVKTYGSVRDI